MQMITYISESKIPTEAVGTELAKILTVAKQRNERLGITGVLFSRGNTFFQTIEGPADAVRAVYQSIMEDDRHDSLYVLIDEPIDQRRFTSWTIECFHDPEPEDGFLGLMHHIGEHFGKLSGFCPGSVYSYCWLTIASMAPYRLAASADAIV